MEGTFWEEAETWPAGERRALPWSRRNGLPSFLPNPIHQLNEPVRITERHLLRLRRPANPDLDVQTSSPVYLPAFTSSLTGLPCGSCTRRSRAYRDRISAWPRCLLGRAALGDERNACTRPHREDPGTHRGDWLMPCERRSSY
jgi:hypothetical protein